MQRGVLYEQGGDREAAIKDYTEAIKLDPSNAVAYFNRGNAYDQMGEHDRRSPTTPRRSSSIPTIPTSTTTAARLTTTRASSTSPSPTTPQPSASTRDRCPRLLQSRA